MAEIENWKEIAPGRYERPLDVLETWYYNHSVQPARDLVREDNVGICISKLEFKEADFRGNYPTSTERIRQAWKALRFRQPVMASFAEDGKRICILPTDDAELEAWSYRTFTTIEDPAGRTGEDYYGRLPLIRQTSIYYFPASQELILRSPHYLIDGLGIVQLFHSLLEIATMPGPVEMGKLSLPLSPPLKIAANIPSMTPEQIEKCGEFLGSMFQSPFIGPALSMSTPRPGGCTRAKITFSVPQTSALLAAAKKRGFTLTHAVHAAAILATRVHGNHDGPENFIAATAFNARSKCVPPLNTVDHACNNYIVPHIALIAPGDFNSTARQLKTYYKHTAQDKDLLQMMTPLVEALISSAKVPNPNPEPIALLGFSSIGDIEPYLRRQYGSVTVSRVSLNTEFVSSAMSVNVFSFRGKLEIQVPFNEGFFSPKSIQNLLQMLIDVLVKELELDASIKAKI